MFVISDDVQTADRGPSQTHQTSASMFVSHRLPAALRLWAEAVGDGPGGSVRRARPSFGRRGGDDVSTYHGGEQIAKARIVLQEHVILSANGLCAWCHVRGPCAEYQWAERAFRRSLRLPQRVPGASRPELINARSLTSRGLLTRAN